MREPSTNEDRILAGLERVTRMGMKKEPLRQILRIDKRRIGRIAKHVKQEK